MSNRINRNRRITFRLSDDEVDLLEKRAKSLGMSVSDFLRLTSNSDTKVMGPAPRRKAPKRLAKTRNADPQLLAQVNWIGNNLNQLVHVLNSEQYSDDRTEVIEILELVIAIERALMLLVEKSEEAQEQEHTKNDD